MLNGFLFGVVEAGLGVIGVNRLDKVRPIQIRTHKPTVLGAKYPMLNLNVEELWKLGRYRGV